MRSERVPTVLSLSSINLIRTTGDMVSDRGKPCTCFQGPLGIQVYLSNTNYHSYDYESHDLEGLSLPKAGPWVIRPQAIRLWGFEKELQAHSLAPGLLSADPICKHGNGMKCAAGSSLLFREQHACITSSSLFLNIYKYICV